MKTWRKIPALFLLVLALLVTMVSPAAAEMLDMNDFNGELITVSKVPKGKAGNKSPLK